MRIVFFGSDDFAATHLQALLANKHEVLVCVTGPDRPQGRGLKISVGTIKQMALEHQIPCLQPLTLKMPGIVETLRSAQADVFVVVAYGRLLTQEILDIPKMLCINVHGSLLPKYRGAAPVNWAILNGDKETGVTLQKMALALDAGEIIVQETMGIGDEENAAQLRQRMATVGAGLLVKTLDQYPTGQFPLKVQDGNSVTYAPKLTKEIGKIDWRKSANSIINQIRGLQPWPGAYTFYNDKMLKISRAESIAQMPGGFRAGEVTRVVRDGFCVACADQEVLVKEVQPEAGKLMPASSFVSGYKISPGSLLF